MLTSAGGSDGFVARLGGDGTVARAVALAGADDEWVSDLALAPDGAVALVAKDAESPFLALYDL